MPQLNGNDIDTCYISFENIIITDKNDNAYFLSPETLTSILHEFNFEVKKKITRTHVVSGEYWKERDHRYNLNHA